MTEQGTDTILKQISERAEALVNHTLRWRDGGDYPRGIYPVVLCSRCYSRIAAEFGSDEMEQYDYTKTYLCTRCSGGKRTHDTNLEGMDETPATTLLVLVSAAVFVAVLIWFIRSMS